MVLSIIVPVYNVEKYLERCLLSILEQQLEAEEYEVLIVNDGSPDNSNVIIDDFVARNENFFSFTKPNGGLSSARNFGLERAKGEYIYFIDSDDYLFPNKIGEILILLKENQLDCISFNYKKITEEGAPLFANMMYSEQGLVTGEYLLNNKTIVSNVWRYIFKAKILRDNNLSFCPGIYHEDEDFTVIYLSYVKRMMHTNTEVYAYIQREGSIINTKDLSKVRKKIFDLVIIISNIAARRNDTDTGIYRGLTRKMEQLLISVFLRLKSDGLKYEDAVQVIDKLSVLGLYPVKIEHLSWKFKLVSKLFNQKMFCKLYFR